MTKLTKIVNSRLMWRVFWHLFWVCPWFVMLNPYAVWWQHTPYCEGEGPAHEFYFPWARWARP